MYREKNAKGAGSCSRYSGSDAGQIVIQKMHRADETDYVFTINDLIVVCKQIIAQSPYTGKGLKCRERFRRAAHCLVFQIHLKGPGRFQAGSDRLPWPGREIDPLP